MKIVLKGGKVFRGGKFETNDVLVVDGKVSRVAPCVDVPEDACVAELGGYHVMPAFVDVHVHFREPGFSYKETIASGTHAAANGGYSLVCTMPNLNPAPDSRENLDRQLELIRENAVVKVVPYGTITRGQKGAGVLADMKEMAPEVVGFSDDGCGVQSDELMREAMLEAARLNKPIVAHCEVNELVRGGYIHDGEYAREHGHKGICSESEWDQVARDVELARETGCRYHVCHVSTRESVEIIRRAKAEGVKVTCETAPHYLILCDEDLQEDGRFKMNPPLRSAQDREALRRGIMDGTIDVIATDHAPHSLEEKSRGLKGSAFGIVGLETAFPMLYRHLVLSGIITLEKLVKLMAIAPRRIFGFGGGIEEGQPADITVYDLESIQKVRPMYFKSKGQSTPFAGMESQGKCLATLVDGRIAYKSRRLTPRLQGPVKKTTVNQ